MRLNIKTGRVVGLAAVAALTAICAAAPARADVVGELACNISGGVGQVVVSSRPVSCVFHSGAGPAELYNGSINRLGIDIGELAGGRLIYNVIAIGTPGPGSLSGDYVGGGFGVTLGTGGGVNVLVGGGGSFALQPVSATTSTGNNIAAGATALRLAYVGPEQGPAPIGRRRVRRMKHHAYRPVRGHHHSAHHQSAHHRHHAH